MFNVSADPHELRDLARSSDPNHVAELAKWKNVMAQQFLAEGRDKYVRDSGKAWLPPVCSWRSRRRRTHTATTCECACTLDVPTATGSC